MFVGFVYGLAATMIWGSVYVIPLLVPECSPILVALSRYTIFGLFSLGLFVKERHQARHLRRDDLLLASALGVVGNLLYYWLLAEAVHNVGASLTGIFTALIPVTAAVAANLTDREARVPWKALLLPLLLIAFGMGLLNVRAFTHPEELSAVSDGLVWGVTAAVLSVVIWTWFPLANAKWLKTHPRFSMSLWAAAQGVTLLPFAAGGLLLYGALEPVPGTVFESPRFLLCVSFLAIAASWGGNVLWNQMSSRLSPQLIGQMLVFEAIFAVLYDAVLAQRLPAAVSFLGMAFVLSGISLSLYRFSKIEAERKQTAQ